MNRGEIFERREGKTTFAEKATLFPSLLVSTKALLARPSSLNSYFSTLIPSWKRETDGAARAEFHGGGGKNRTGETERSD